MKLYRWFARCLVMAAVMTTVTGSALAQGSRTNSAKSSGGNLVITVAGLPPSQVPNVRISGPTGARSVKTQRLVLRHVTPGLYRVNVRQLRIDRAWRTVVRDARVFPRRGMILVRVRSGRTTTVLAAYGTIVNPRVSALPHGLVRVVGDPTNPQELVYGAGANLPTPGEVLTAAPSSLLPDGLVARVTSAHNTGSAVVLSVMPVSVTTAVPEFDYSGAADLQPALDAHSANARAIAASCSGDASRYDVGASLNQFQIRQASAKLWPPQMSFTLAARTTEHAGLNIASAGVKCNWDIATLGPWRGAIPTPIVPIPVYAEIPITANADIGGSLSAFRLNFVSTHVVTVDLGHQNDFAFQEQGSNAWTDGVLQLSGHADISLALALQFGVGDPRAGNLHVNVGFGAYASWDSGSGCDVTVKLGSVSAGVKIGPLSASTPPWTAATLHLWHGCAARSTPAPSGGGTAAGSTTTPATTVPGSAGSGSTGPGPTGGGGIPSGAHPETVGGVTHTWTDPSNAGGTQGPSIQTGQTVGIACKLQGFRVADGDTWWYRIASSPWNGAYYASADAFYNNGHTTGSLTGTPFVDPNVPDCNPAPPPPPPTYAETVGGVTHTWTNYTNAGGTQGPSIQTGQTVAVSCKVQGFRVADGDTWWYRIASSPWNSSYYASADAFYNNGQTSGSLIGTPFVDNNVSNC